MTKNNRITRKQASTPDLKAATAELNRARFEAAKARKASDACLKDTIKMIGNLKRSMKAIKMQP
jgi:hypothetical protein